MPIDTMLQRNVRRLECLHCSFRIPRRIILSAVTFLSALAFVVLYCSNPSRRNELVLSRSKHLRKESPTVSADFDDEVRKNLGTKETLAIVYPSDTILVRPSNNGPIVAPITGYNWRGAQEWPNLYYELPIYKDLDRNDDTFWNYLVDELLLARVNVVMLHGRGCWDLESGTQGSGDMCPRVLTKLVEAVKRANAQEVLRFGMWDDTGAYNKALQHVEHLPRHTKMDLSNRRNWKYFWDHNIKIWFDTIPREWWFLMDDGRPIIASWILKDDKFTNQQGNASSLLKWLKLQFRERYGVEPLFILDRTWFEVDSTITSNEAVGAHGWFKPESNFQSSTHSYREYNGATWGVIAPSFRDSQTVSGCGKACREVTRRDGETLVGALDQGRQAKFILLEGWTDMIESAGFYRSNSWSYPNKYNNLVRRYADPEPETLRFQAESADTLVGKSRANPFRTGNFDIQELHDNSGWFVRFSEAGEWLQYQEIQLGCGTYRFTARVATIFEDKNIRLDLDGFDNVEVPVSNDWQDFQLVHLGEINLHAGKYNLKIVSDSGDVNIDWFFVKRTNKKCDSVVLPAK